MGTERLETFSDGVFAIAATLLIIDVSVHAPGSELGHAILHAWPQYAAYVVSFITIGIMWINHHTCMRLIDRCDRTFLVINLLLLMCIAFVPFPTNLIAEHIRHEGLEASALTYGVNLTLTACCFGLFWFYAVRNRRLIADDADPKIVAGISRSYLPGAPIYAIATLTALVSPTASVIMFGLITVFYVFESSIFGGTPVEKRT